MDFPPPFRSSRSTPHTPHTAITCRADNIESRAVRRDPAIRAAPDSCDPKLESQSFRPRRHRGVLRRIQIQPDNIGALGPKLSVAAGHVALQPMWPQLDWDEPLVCSQTGCAIICRYTTADSEEAESRERSVPFDPKPGDSSGAP